MTILDFFVPMPRPVAKARPRLSKGHTYTPRATKDAEGAIAMFARQAIRGSGMGPCFPLDGAVRLNVTVMVPRPKGCKDEFPTKRPDGDNYLKLVQDALNGTAYKDDAQVVDSRVTKVYAGELQSWNASKGAVGYLIHVGQVGA